VAHLSMLSPFLALAAALVFALEIGLMALVMVLDFTELVTDMYYDLCEVEAIVLEDLIVNSPSGNPAVPYFRL
jgi:hypothetical protein